MSKEEWRDVVGWEGLYQVSSLGRVKRVAPGKKTYPGKILKPQKSTVGYPWVNLTKNGKHVSLFIHRIVATAFLERGVGKTEVNHKNGDRTDCRLSNLEWVTKSENRIHARDVLGVQFNPNPTHGPKHHRSKLTEHQVTEIRDLYATGNYTHQQLANMFGISKPQAGKIIRRDFWKHVP